jgi:hypothetical protein
MKKILFFFLFPILACSGQTWYPVNNNFHNGYPVCFGVYQNQLFGGGNFTLIGNTSANGIARFDGYWHPVLNGTNGGYPYATAIYNNELYK